MMISIIFAFALSTSGLIIFKFRKKQERKDDYDSKYQNIGCINVSISNICMISKKIIDDKKYKEIFSNTTNCNELSVNTFKSFEQYTKLLFNICEGIWQQYFRNGILEDCPSASQNNLNPIYNYINSSIYKKNSNDNTILNLINNYCSKDHLKKVKNEYSNLKINKKTIKKIDNNLTKINLFLYLVPFLSFIMIALILIFRIDQNINIYFTLFVSFIILGTIVFFSFYGEIKPLILALSFLTIGHVGVSIFSSFNTYSSNQISVYNESSIDSKNRTNFEDEKSQLIYELKKEFGIVKEI